LDESALAACLAKVGLNPIRAGMADTLEGSEFTCIQRRIEDLKSAADNSIQDEAPAGELFPFVGNPREEMPKGLPFALTDYHTAPVSQ